jgi:hypothetical protein
VCNSCRFLIVVGTALVLLAQGGVARAMRCKGKVVSDGEPKAEVLDSCGSPACIRAIPPETVLTVYRWKSGVYVPMALDEEWVYNFGPHRLIYYVRFYQGKVADTDATGYGWREGEGCEQIPEQMKNQGEPLLSPYMPFPCQGIRGCPP